MVYVEVNLGTRSEEPGGESGKEGDTETAAMRAIEAWFPWNLLRSILNAS